MKKEPWTPAEHALIEQRAAEIARSPQTAMETRTHAETMLRAEELARANPLKSDDGNWFLAESQYKAHRARVEERVRRIAPSPEAARALPDDAPWVRHAEIQVRAEDIARANPRNSDNDNWLLAESQYGAHRRRVEERVRLLAASPEAARGHWLQAQRELMAEGRIPRRDAG